MHADVPRPVLDGGALTAALVDVESVSKHEQRIANLVEDALPPQGAPGPD